MKRIKIVLNYTCIWIYQIQINRILVNITFSTNLEILQEFQIKIRKVSISYTVHTERIRVYNNHFDNFTPLVHEYVTHRPIVAPLAYTFTQQLHCPFRERVACTQVRARLCLLVGPHALHTCQPTNVVPLIPRIAWRAQHNAAVLAITYPR